MASLHTCNSCSGCRALLLANLVPLLLGSMCRVPRAVAGHLRAADAGLDRDHRRLFRNVSAHTCFSWLCRLRLSVHVARGGDRLHRARVPNTSRPVDFGWSAAKMPIEVRLLCPVNEVAATAECRSSDCPKEAACVRRPDHGWTVRLPFGCACAACMPVHLVLLCSSSHADEDGLPGRFAAISDTCDKGACALALLSMWPFCSPALTLVCACLPGGAAFQAFNSMAFIFLTLVLAMRLLQMCGFTAAMSPYKTMTVELVLAFGAIACSLISIIIWGASCYHQTKGVEGLARVVPTGYVWLILGFLFNLIAGIIYASLLARGGVPEAGPSCYVLLASAAPNVFAVLPPCCSPLPCVRVHDWGPGLPWSHRC